MSHEITTSAGSPQPFGISRYEGGVNFALYSKYATDMRLCLFDYPSLSPICEVLLDPNVNKTGYVWHVLVHNLPEQVCYNYRISKSKGKLFNKLFNPDNLILDPYAKAVATPQAWDLDGKPYTPIGIVPTTEDFNWEEDVNPQIPMKDLIIYEMHVRGFTRDSSSQVSAPGSFLGMIEKIPHLVDLGVNAVELLPVHEFNECEFTRYNPLDGSRLYNYWGYSPVNFFAPMNRYASKDGYAQVVTEFKTMVKELHKNGIEVILDVVFNHTAEGNEHGPIYSFKGIDCGTYYILDQRHHLQDYTGCGNTFNSNNPITRELIRRCLQYWVSEMHVDGFRFDLGAILMRGTFGEPLDHAPIIDAISEDPILATTKLIAEPWDASGLYRLGGFYPNKDRWSEWNDKFRETMRHFIKGDQGEKRKFAIAICGSDDIFNRETRTPSASLDYITCHDGFTLRDLVSYNSKNNTANAENDHDGNPSNTSWNCGIEGETDDPDVLQIREQQMRNFHLTLMITQGTPMLLMGDEYGHTRYGNNNSWCQDSTLNWFLWDKLKEKSGYYRFYKELIHFRKRYNVLPFGRYLTPDDVQWHGVNPFDPDWEGDTRFIAMTIKDPENKYQFYVAFNMHQEQITLTLPDAPFPSGWHKIVDTSAAPPMDFINEMEAPLIEQGPLTLNRHTSILLKCTA